MQTDNFQSKKCRWISVSISVNSIFVVESIERVAYRKVALATFSSKLAEIDKCQKGKQKVRVAHRDSFNSPFTFVVYFAVFVCLVLFRFTFQSIVVGNRNYDIKTRSRQNLHFVARFGRIFSHNKSAKYQKMHTKFTSAIYIYATTQSGRPHSPTNGPSAIGVHTKYRFGSTSFGTSGKLPTINWTITLI